MLNSESDNMLNSESESCATKVGLLLSLSTIDSFGRSVVGAVLCAICFCLLGSSYTFLVRTV